MFLTIEVNRTGEMLACRRIAPNEKLDIEALVHREIKKIYDDEEDHYWNELELAENMYSGSADVYAQIRTRKNDSLCVWSSADFFLKNCGFE
ncbi:MAG: hypothetical protein ACPGC3_02555 [Paracoccaceae bacterium]